MNRQTLSFCAVALLAFALTARAQLAWEKTEIELHPGANDATAVGVFKYQNKGDKTVHISSVHTSCGCTTAGVAKNDVAPNEKGEITATFNIGGRTGVQQKTVTVTTDDPKQPTTLLTLKAVIAQGVEATPSFVYWQLGEEPKEKIVTVKTPAEMQVKTLEVIASSPEFSTKVAPGSAAGEFKVFVVPRETGRPNAANITITPVGGNGGRATQVTARVTNSKAATD